MKKIFITLFKLVFSITLLLSFYSLNASAYQNSSYFSNIKVGLVSMSSTSINISTNGNYTVNGTLYPSGTTFAIGISGTSLTLNGSVQPSISFTPDKSSNLLNLSSNSISNNYLGSFNFIINKGKILPINIIDIESYLKGVVGYEMSDSFPIEALKAQAVAARNYALSRIGFEAANGYDFDDTSGYQTYKGYNPINTNTIKAVDQTRGQVLTYNNSLVETLYSAWHGGISEDSENVWGNYVPYLRSVQDSYENDPWPNGNRTFTNAAIETILKNKGYIPSTSTFVKIDLSSITKFPSGRISSLNIIYNTSSGSTLVKSFTKDSTRTFLTLPSNLYTVTYDPVGGIYTFSGKGNGHGMGMSQIGAKNRAAAGQAYDQILKFYYQNVSLDNLIQKASISSFALSSSSLLASDTISMNTTGAQGNGYGYLYKYVIKNGNDVVFTGDYSESQSLNYTPTTSGNYSATVYLKDKYSPNDFDDMRSLSFTVYDIPSITLSATTNAAITGTNININASTINGSGNTNYRFVISKDSSLISDTGFASNASISFVPTSKGTYTVTAYTKDALSTKDFDAQTTYIINIFSPYLTQSTATGSFYEGKPLTITTGNTGASPSGFCYKYSVYYNNTLVTSTNFSTSGDFSFTPAVSGTYNIKVYGKDQISTNNYDTSQQFNIVVNSKPLILTSLPLCYGTTSNDVTALQTALIKLGYPISSATGYFGTQTRSAVISFQSSHSIQANGIVDTATYNALNDILISNCGIITKSF